MLNIIRHQGNANGNHNEMPPQAQELPKLQALTIPSVGTDVEKLELAWNMVQPTTLETVSLKSVRTIRLHHSTSVL